MGLQTPSSDSINKMSRDSRLVIAIWTILCVIAVILWVLTVKSQQDVFYAYYFSVFQLLTSVGAAVLCYRTTLVLEADDKTRTAWGFLSMGLWCWSVGALLEGLYTILHPDMDVPFPWYADIGFLLLIPFVVMALLTFKKGQNVGIPRWGLVTATVMFLCAFSLALKLNFEVFENLSSVAIIITVAYIILDSILLAMIVAVASTLAGGLISRPWQVALVGWFIFYLGDVSYTFFRNIDKPDAGGILLDLTWPIAFGLIALAATLARGIYKSA